MTIVREYARKSQTSPRSRPRAILDSNLNRKRKKQTTTAAATENKQKNKAKQNKTGGVREFLEGSEKEKLRSIILR